MIALHLVPDVTERGKVERGAAAVGRFVRPGADAVDLFDFFGLREHRPGAGVRAQAVRRGNHLLLQVTQHIRPPRGGLALGAERHPAPEIGQEGAGVEVG